MIWEAWFLPHNFSKPSTTGKNAWPSLKVLDLPSGLTQMHGHPSQSVVGESLAPCWCTRKPILFEGLNSCLIHSSLVLLLLLGCLLFSKKLELTFRRVNFSEEWTLNLWRAADKHIGTVLGSCLEACSASFLCLQDGAVLWKQSFECMWKHIYMYQRVLWHKANWNTRNGNLMAIPFLYFFFKSWKFGKWTKPTLSNEGIIANNYMWKWSPGHAWACTMKGGIYVYV